jgi:hypothetical protein
VGCLVLLLDLEKGRVEGREPIRHLEQSIRICAARRIRSPPGFVSVLHRRPGEPSAALESASIADCAAPATFADMDDLQHIAGIAIVCGAALFFALMAWAGQHHS